MMSYSIAESKQVIVHLGLHRGILIIRVREGRGGGGGRPQFG